MLWVAVFPLLISEKLNYIRNFKALHKPLKQEDESLPYDKTATY